MGISSFISKLSALTLLAAVCSACGGNATSNPSEEHLGGTQALEACNATPTHTETFDSSEELNASLVGRWRRCGEPQARGEDVGVEFTADGRWHALTTDDTGNVIRREGFGGVWQYGPPGSPDPISNRPSREGFLILDGVITNPPTIGADPTQMRILFSPVQSKYVPLDSGE